MELRQLKIFCEAAKTLNFTKAAENLGYAQSNITSQIRLLENELGIKLFERLGRGIKITNEGTVFYNDAKHIIDLCTQAKKRFAPTRYYGNLNIGAAETICVYYLPKILTKYKKLYPQVEIRILTDSCEFFYEYIRANAIDIAMVLTDEIMTADMITEKLCNEEMVLVASPSHPFSQLKKPTWHDLNEENLIITLPGCGYRPLILAMLKDNNIVPGSTIELSSVASIRHCTMAGLGISILPRVAVRDDLAHKKLKEIKLPTQDLAIKSLLVYHNKKWISPAMQAFLDLCHEINFD